MDLPKFIEMPWYASKAISILENAGYEAFIVGGCVRDTIMGRKPHDWDICTSAKPEEMKKVFKDLHTIETGIQHGTITVIFKSEDENVPVEVTTYRIDGEYSDGRHPDSVQFAVTIEEDLSRRDFTMNAIAYNPTIGFIDPFDGLKDIENKRIKCVNNPMDRLKEDPLRILRAFRFCAQLDFGFDLETYTAIINTTYEIQKLSKERISSEMLKMIQCSNFWEFMKFYPFIFIETYPEMKEIYHFNQKNKHHIYDVYEHTLYALRYVRSNDPIVKFAIFFHDIGKKRSVVVSEGNGAYHFPGHSKVSHDMTREILIRNRFDNKSIDLICQLVLYHDMEIIPTPSKVKRAIRKFDKYGMDMAKIQFERYLLIREADIMAQNPEYTLDKLENIFRIRVIFEQIQKEEPVMSLKDLNITGKDIVSMGIKPGPKVGQLLNMTLEGVIDGSIQNIKEELINHIINMQSNKEV